MNDTVYWYWLSKALGAASPNVDIVLEKADNNAKNVFDRLDSFFDEKQITKSQYQHAKTYQLSNIEKEIGQEEKQGIQVIGFLDERYPSLLRNIPSPPLVLHIKGDASVLHEPLCISVVGTRKPSAYGSEAIDVIASGLVKAGVVVVSGLASGLDSIAHKAAISRGKPTIAVIGGGLDTYYPIANKKLQQLIEKYGAVVSEYPLGTRPEKHHFLQRNRIIAGLSSGLCVAEARKQSGTMSTVRYALEAGRDVFAVPGSIFSLLSEGTNALLKEGAYCATQAADILSVYGISIEQEVLQETGAEEIKLSENAEQIKQYLGRETQTLTELCEKSKLAPGTVLAALSELEMESIAKKLPGQRYAIAL